MLLDVIYSICFNICLLVVLAFMMTKMDFVQRLLLNEEGGSEEGRGESVWQRLLEKVLLGVIFGVFCIISDYIGIQVTGALPNARVIGVLSAGFLGGPVSGFITTVIAAAHRYLIFPERISTVACVLSAIIVVIKPETGPPRNPADRTPITRAFGSAPVTWIPM